MASNDRSVATAIAAFMRAEGCKFIYHNKYSYSRSVKCYGSGDAKWDRRFVNDLEILIKVLRVDATVRYRPVKTEANCYRALGPSVIVNIPYFGKY